MEYLDGVYSVAFQRIETCQKFAEIVELLKFYQNLLPRPQFRKLTVHGINHMYILEQNNILNF
jgi:hypothetical protein